MTNLGRATEAEIHSQPMIWEDVLRVFRQGADIGLPSPDAYEEIVFTGCGSTYFLAMSAASLLEDHAGIPARALPASEIILSSQDRRPVGPRLLVAISRSGSTTETVEAARIFRERLDADVLAITCHPNSPLGAQAGDILSAEPAQESSVVQTRSFTSMLLLSAGWITRHLGEAPAKELRNQGEQLLERHGPFFDRLGSEPDLQRFFILGGGARHGLAREAALKICEMCLDDATAYNGTSIARCIRARCADRGSCGSSRGLDPTRRGHRIGSRRRCAGPVEPRALSASCPSAGTGSGAREGPGSGSTIESERRHPTIIGRLNQWRVEARRKEGGYRSDLMRCGSTTSSIRGRWHS